MENEQIWGEVLPDLEQDLQLFDVKPTLDFDTAMQFIIDERNASTIEFNEVFDENEAMKETLAKASDLADKHIELLTANNTLKSEHETLFSSHKSLLEAYNKIIVKNDSLAGAYKSTLVNYELLKGQKETADKLLKVTTKDLKAVKQNSANHKKSNDVLTKRNARLIQDSKVKPNHDQVVDIPQLNTVYEVNDEMLIVYPQRHLMNNGTSLIEQAVLLYSDMRGVFLTVCLDDENQAVFSSPINTKELSERTIATYRKHSISPSEPVRAFATQWLYRINIEQKMKVERYDLLKFTGEQ